jgi:hypothetical protein
MGEITFRQALDQFQTVYMPSRNYAVRTREEYLKDIEDLVMFLEKSGVNKVGEVSLPQMTTPIEFGCKISVMLYLK